MKSIHTNQILKTHQRSIWPCIKFAQPPIQRQGYSIIFGIERYVRGDL